MRHSQQLYNHPCRPVIMYIREWSLGIFSYIDETNYEVSGSESGILEIVCDVICDFCSDFVSITLGNFVGNTLYISLFISICLPARSCKF